MYTVEWFNKGNVKDMQVSDLKVAYDIAKKESVNFEGCIKIIGDHQVLGLIARFEKGVMVFP
jgi:hypothetical protein